MNREWKRFYLNNMQQAETKIQMIKMVNEFKLTVVHFARPNPMQICACAWIYRWTKKNCGKSGLGRRAAGLLLAKPDEHLLCDSATRGIYKFQLARRWCESAKMSCHAILKNLHEPKMDVILTISLKITAEIEITKHTFCVLLCSRERVSAFWKDNYVLSFIHCHGKCVYIAFLLLIARLMRLAIILPAEVSWKRE